jgi:hypothetical protein
MAYYLAYGSNMNEEQMKRRCPSATFIQSGILKGYRLAFAGYSKNWGGPVADIRKDPGSEIPYVLWEISLEDDIRYLNRKEGHPSNYDKMNIELAPYKDVFTYYMTEQKKNKRIEGRCVPKAYEGVIRKAYQENDLPQKYLDDALDADRKKSVSK